MPTALASARCDWRASIDSALSRAMSRSSTSIFGVAGVATSASLASGAEILVTCQESLRLGLITTSIIGSDSNQTYATLLGILTFERSPVKVLKYHSK